MVRVLVYYLKSLGKKISETLKEKYKNGELKTNPNFSNKEPWNKGKVDVYSFETKEKISNSLKGKIPWNKGLKGFHEAWNKGLKTGPQSEESKNKKSDTFHYLQCQKH